MKGKNKINKALTNLFENLQDREENEIIEVKKKIYFDKRQDSCKLPMNIMQEVFSEGDQLKFTLDLKNKKKVIIEYVKEDDAL